MQRRSATWERPADERIVGGVCSAIAQRTEIDVTLIRLAFVVLALAKGVGIVLYGALWLALPPAGARGQGLRARLDPDRLRGELARTRSSMGRAWQRTERISSWPRPIDRRWIAIGLIAVGTGIVLMSFGAFSWLTVPRAIGLAALAIGIGTLVTLTSRGGKR